MTNQLIPDRAISIKAPWWWAMLNLPPEKKKDIENRGWKLPDKHVGKMLWLHTGQRPDVVDAWYAIRNAAGKFPPRDRLELHLGCIVGVIRFSRDVTSSDSVWFGGPHGWVIDGAVALPNPVPCKGALGFFRPSQKAQRLCVDQIMELPDYV